MQILFSLFKLKNYKTKNITGKKEKVPRKNSNNLLKNLLKNL